MKTNADILAAEQDKKNLKKISDAFSAGRIDAAAKDYLDTVYADGMNGFRNGFYFLGQTLGAPKTPIYPYDSQNGDAGDKELQIADVGPSGTYIVHHRFDADPMRNQFFTFGGTNIQLFVSSIVSVIVAAQKSVGRAIDKVTGKYYDDYLNDILAAVARVLTKHKKAQSIAAIQDKVEKRFRAQFISFPAPEVLKIIGNMFPEISVDFVRELDKIVPPFARLNDIFRMKMLFDTVPQINAFITHVQHIMPESVIKIRNKFYDLDNDRDYRDAKMIIGFNYNGQIIPMEVICNVRTFFEFERQSHTEYESLRSNKKTQKNLVNEMHHNGVIQYNTIICQAVHYLIHRVGWNIIYEKDLGIDSFFRGFPRIEKLPYENKIVDVIIDKIDNNVRNEVFTLPATPRELSEQEELSVFRYIAQFILFAALPYSYKYEEIKNMGFPGKVFNFVMKELYRYYENDVL